MLARVLNRESLKVFWTVVAVTALLGWIPMLVTFGVTKMVVAHLGHDWDFLTGGFFLTVLYFALFGAGAYICAKYL